jgi:hypothetical protein
MTMIALACPTCVRVVRIVKGRFATHERSVCTGSHMTYGSCPHSNRELTSEELEARVGEFIGDMLGELPERSRVEVMAGLAFVYCKGCGRPQEGGYCQCQNDE